MGPNVRRYRVAVMLARIALFIVLDCLIVKIKQGFGIALTPTQLVMTLITAASFQVVFERIVVLGYAIYTAEVVDGFVKSKGAYTSDWILLRQVRLLWRTGWDVLAGTGKLDKKAPICIFCGNCESEHRLFCPSIQFNKPYDSQDELGEGAELVDDERTGNLPAKKMDANELRNIITKVSKRVRRPFSTEFVRPTTSSNSEQVSVTLSSETFMDLIVSNSSYVVDWEEVQNTSSDPYNLTMGFVLEPEEMVFEFKDSLQASKYSARSANHKGRKSRNVMTIQEPPVTGEMSDQLESCEGRSTAYLTEAKWIVTHYLKRKSSVRIHPCSFEVRQYRPVGFSFNREQVWRKLYQDFGSFQRPRMVHISDYINIGRITFEKTKPNLHDKFICYYCSRALRRDRFAKRQVSREFLPGHANALKRFCIDCGIKNKTFKPGNQITIHGLPFRICQDCSIPTLGRFCTQCNTCGSCLGQGEYSGPSNAKCPRCDHKTLRLHVDQHCRELLGNIDEQIPQVRALVNILGACMCEDCSRCMDELTMKPKPMDIVQQGLQYEVYHFSRIGKLRLSQIPQHWAPAIVRGVGGNNMRIGFEDPRLNLAEGTKIPKTCYLKECGSAEQLVDAISKGRRTRIPGF